MGYNGIQSCNHLTVFLNVLMILQKVIKRYILGSNSNQSKLRRCRYIIYASFLELEYLVVKVEPKGTSKLFHKSFFSLAFLFLWCVYLFVFFCFVVFCLGSLVF